MTRLTEKIKDARQRIAGDAYHGSASTREVVGIVLDILCLIAEELARVSVVAKAAETKAGRYHFTSDKDEDGV